MALIKYIVPLLLNDKMKGHFQKNQHAPFLEDENIFQKIGPRGTDSIAIPHRTMRADF